ncbi:unnamed protein product [Prorocentrum cordatum]|uniref:Uncharacterized protein n=1 Tax=Prorocentrum cordatum TaxID=2364126 RepID=A0ABN9XQJ3_9DINO|nr:unnamed protein product [Polarella glacialis]
MKARAPLARCAGSIFHGGARHAGCTTRFWMSLAHPAADRANAAPKMVVQETECVRTSRRTTTARTTAPPGGAPPARFRTQRRALRARSAAAPAHCRQPRPT